MVRVSKNVISAIAARDYYRSINTEELNTYFKKAKGILDWKPLTPLSDDIDDFHCLCPMSILNLVQWSILLSHLATL